MKSLDELRGSALYIYVYVPNDDLYVSVDTDDLTDEIQAEIDRYYLPRPLFEDGEPAQFEEEYVDSQGEVHKVVCITYYADHFEVSDGRSCHCIDRTERLQRPREVKEEKKNKAREGKS